MKRLLIIIALFLPLTLIVSCHREASLEQESELYMRYASRPEITVAQVSGFKLCDTITVDVVLLQADNDTIWQQMIEEFGILDTAGVTSWLGDIDNPALHVKWEGQPVLRVAASHKKHSIGLYRLDTETQYDALLDYQLDNLN